MMKGSREQIAGKRTCKDWDVFKSSLEVGGDGAAWQTAFEDFYFERLRHRYLDPIKVIQENGTLQGEGFSIVTLQCSLIEFLESTIQGKSYRYAKQDKDLSTHEYRLSGEMFVNFLCTREPFVKEFTKSVAQDFYEGVRCGLLHEARTKKNWRIWARSPDGKSVIDVEKKLLYRDGFQKELDMFIEWYRVALLSNSSFQEAFVRKFDSLCTCDAHVAPS